MYLQCAHLRAWKNQIFRESGFRCDFKTEYSPDAKIPVGAY